MTKVLILGANGQLARNTTRVFLEKTDVALTLYLRRASRLRNPDPGRVKIVEGDVLDAGALRARHARTRRGLRQSCRRHGAAGPRHHRRHARRGLKRLIFVSSMGIYGEVPGETYRSVLDPYRDSAAEIEKSDLDYTILRPGWFTRDKGVGYRITQKGEPFMGHDVSLDGLSDLITKLAADPGLYRRCSIGVSNA